MKKVLFIIPELSHGGTNKSLEFLLPHLINLCTISIVSLQDKGVYEETFQPYNLNSVGDTYIKFKKSIIYRILNRFFQPVSNFLLNCIFQSEARRISKLINPDIVVAYQEGEATLFASKFNQKKISWIHCDYKLYRDIVTSMNEYGIYNKFNHIICVSKYTARSFVNYYPQLSQKVSYMYNVLDIEKINELALYNVMDKRFNVTNDSFVCISVGRYVDVKQFDRIPSIVSQVMSKGISKKLLWYIIGDGDEKLIKYTNEEIKKYGLENNIVLLGAKTNPYPYIKSSNLLITLSKSEACPYVINEAKILKVPLLSTDYPSAVELIGKEQGLIRSISDFPEAICHLIEDKEGVYTKIHEAAQKNNYINDVEMLKDIICS